MAARPYKRDSGTVQYGQWPFVERAAPAGAPYDRRVSAPAPAVAVALRDGSTVSLRPVRPDDVGRLERFLRELDPEAARLRFFSAGADLRRAAEAFAAPDARVRGLVALLGEDDRVVGHAEYAREGPRPSAEVAFEVAESCREWGSRRSSSPIWPRTRQRTGSPSSPPKCFRRTTG
jgi:hypothetical protein